MSHLRADDLIVAPNGRDDWTGRLAEPEPQRQDGPLATVMAAVMSVRIERVQGRCLGPVTIWLRGGPHALKRPIELTADDRDLTIAAWPGETPIIDGGVRITGWTVGTVAGRAAWTAQVGDLVERIGPWRSLFVDGARRTRSRLPKQGWYRIERAPGADPARFDLFSGGADRFIAKTGDLQPWKNLTDIDVVVAHFWIDERMPIASYDPATRLVISSRASVFTLVDSWNNQYAKYHLENVGEALSEPGEWYLDRTAGTLTYLPLPGETPESTVVVVPRVCQLLRLVADPREDRAVRNITVRGLVFEHTDWHQPKGYGVWYDPELPSHRWHLRDSFAHLHRQTENWQHREWANTPQAALHVPGVVHLHGARNCAIDACTIRHTGWHGVSLYEGCTGNRITGCSFDDLGAGAIIADGGDERSPLNRRTGENAFTDNRITGNGQLWPSACGICTAHSAGNVISHNELFDLTYTGISAGWIWGLGPNVSRDNRIEHNHIHHLAQRGGMSDLGGIYLLGIQPGTVVRGNHIHHVESAAYGGHGIYLDEGASCVLVEGNVVWRCNSNALMEHWGRSNLVRDNLFACCGLEEQRGDDPRSQGSLIMLCRHFAHRQVPWPPRTTQIFRNLLISHGAPIYLDNENALADHHLDAECNVIWDLSRTAPELFRCLPWPNLTSPGQPLDQRLDAAQWRARGHDRHGLITDPRCRDPRNGDFTVPEDSPIHAHGFTIPDVSRCGPR